VNVGIVGLGLIGGSLAKAYQNAGHTVYALDKDPSVTEFAMLQGVVTAPLADEALPACELVLICVYPEAAVAFLSEKSALLSKAAVVIDCCGTKRRVCEAGFAAAGAHGFTFVGGHPMAGKQHSGYKYAAATLFRGAPMVIVPPRYDDIELYDRVKALLAPAGFGKLSVTDAESHDRMIAFTSQLAHVVSNAYVKSPEARRHRGFSAGSYKDLTRVAKLNAGMWSELFLENGDFLCGEIETIAAHLLKYRDAIRAGDRPALVRLLQEGSDIKEEIDG